MDILITLVVGAVIGWLAGALMKTAGQQTLLMDILIGLVGSGLGYALAGALGIGATNTLGLVAIQVGGAVVLIAILRALRVMR